MENLRCAVCGQFVTDGDYRLIVVGKPDEGIRIHYKCMDSMPMWMRMRLSAYIRVLRREKGVSIRSEDMPREHNSPLTKYVLED